MKDHNDRALYGKLIDEKVVECSADEASVQFRDSDRTVRRTEYRTGHFISTIFLVINHGHASDLWFETMVFGEKGTDEIEMDGRRYATYEGAVVGHNEFVVHWNKKLNQTGVTVTSRTEIVIGGLTQTGRRKIEI